MKKAYLVSIASIIAASVLLYEGKIVAYNYIYDDNDCVISCYCPTATPPGPSAIMFGSSGACNASCTARKAACPY